MKKRTLYDKIWDSRKVFTEDGEDILYVDRHLIHEVTSPQAFARLKKENRRLHRKDRTLAIMDHNISTRSRKMADSDALSLQQMKLLQENTQEFQIPLLGIDHPDQGIVHVVGPELGLTQPGTLIVCGDSHTSTHGAFGSLAFGIGTSEIEHVFATQTIRLQKSKNFKIEVSGKLSKNVSAKDLALHIIHCIGTEGGQGYVIEFCGDTITSLSMEARMTLCNMCIEAGARAGLIAPDNTTFKYLQDKDNSPKGEDWYDAVARWKGLFSDEGAYFDKEVSLHAEECQPRVSWGTNPSQSVAIGESIPFTATFKNTEEKKVAKLALKYMGLQEGKTIKDIPVDKVFIGSCTNSRIEDLREVARVVKGRKIHVNVQAIIVPGSMRVKRQAENEGLDTIFKKSGFEWRFSGCSLCLAMNEDRLNPQERCASTSNRNFEGRQGRGGRTHLVSPHVAAATAIFGRFATVDDL
ncbi:MAG: 3-isopropylmalate dehydratase large subunit [Spirochaetota bacterium]